MTKAYYSAVLDHPLADRPSPARYEGTMHLLEIVEGDRTFIEWSVALDTAPQDADRWRTLFQSLIPEWANSLSKALERNARCRN